MLIDYKNIMHKFMCLAFLVVLALFLLTSGCTQEDKSNAIDTKNIVETLVSPENKGRAVGSKGNENAGEYIAGVYEKLGLKPLLRNTYAWPYIQNLCDIDLADPKVVLYFNDGTVRELKLGAEINIIFGKGATDIKLSLTVDLNAGNINDKIFLFKDSLGTPAYHKDNEILKTSGCKYSFVPIEQLRFNPAANTQDTKLITCQIKRNIYDTINWDNVIEASIKINDAVFSKTVNNIVGYIPGKDSSKAVIISAHFDAGGSLGDVYSTGAVDNASGVAAMLRAAAKLAEGDMPQKDIIFCSFNGEETFLWGGSGSEAFCNEITRHYEELVNINIDCVGSKGSSSYNIVCENKNISRLLFDEFTKILKDKRIAYEMSDYTAGDHVIFGRNGIPNICLLQDDLIDITHTVDDIPDVLNYGLIDQFGDSVAEFIISSGEMSFRASHNDHDNHDDYNDQGDVLWSEIEAMVKTVREEQKLAYDEVYSFKVGSYYVSVANNEPISYNDFKEYFPGFFIQDIVTGPEMFPYHIETVSVYTPEKNMTGYSYTESPIIPLNEKYKIDFNITYGIKLVYKDSDSDMRVLIEVYRNYQFDTSDDHYINIDNQNIENADRYYLHKWNPHSYEDSYTQLIYYDKGLYIEISQYDPINYDAEYQFYPSKNFSKDDMDNWIGLLDISGNDDYYRDMFDNLLKWNNAAASATVIRFD
ncbi:MAG: M28 family metallopeptidase [Clostridiales bacterium]|nr:M28 family metallopeptidase [Clostridiales bacterium]